MALIGGNLNDYVDKSGNVNISTYSGYSGGSNYNNSGSGSGSGYNSVNSNYKDTAKNTAPVAEFNPYANGVPQSIIDAQNELNLRSIPNQQYAQMVQDTIIKDNLGYLSDPNYKGTYSAIEASQAFDYLTRANNGASYSNWSAPKADDQLFTEIVPQWDAARNIRASATEQYNKPVATMEDSIVQSIYNNPQLSAAQKEILQANNIQSGDWRTMSWQDQLKALAVPSSNLEDSGVLNAPSWAKYVQNIFPSLMAGAAGGAIGQIFGPVGSAIGFGITAGLTYLQGVTNVEIPVINELLYGMDILSVWAEQAQGAIGASLKETWDRSMADGTTDLIELGKTMGDVLKDFPDLWEIGQLSYEVGADLGFDNVLNFGRNAVAGISDTLFGTDIGQADTNTISRANLGLGGLVTVNPETRGYDSLTNVYMPLYRTIRDEAVKQGMEYKDAKEYALNYISENLNKYMGTTGLANDFAASSLFDPLNFIPTIEADVAEKIGTKTHDSALVKAAKTAKEGASPIVDAFSTPLIQPIVEFVTGKHGTQGMDTIIRTYVKELQQSVPVKDLTQFQRRIAGIDDAGLLKNFKHETNIIKRWLGTSEEAKIFNMSENVVSILGSALFDTDTNPELIPEIISQFLGLSPISPDGPLSKYADTALMRTIKSSIHDYSIEDVQKIQKRVNNFRNLNINRMAFDAVADQLHIKKGDLFDMLDDPERSAELKQRILKENISFADPHTNIAFTPEDIYDKIDVFSSGQVGRTQYSLDLLKADIMDTISKKSQEGLLSYYDIKPDAWFNRLGEVTKNMQSVALLNYSPSYFVNNFLNNIITRSVAGIGGFDNKTIQTMSEKRGLSFSREDPAYKKTKHNIIEKKSKPDLIGKIKDTWGKISDDKKPVGKILKGFNNIDIEKLETRAAFEIGANKYWDATWKPGLNIPDLPIELQTLGITDEMKKTIYKTAMDSSTLSEFKKKLIGDVILPGMNSTLTDMISKRYNDTTGPIIRNLIDSNPMIKEQVATLLETGNPELIRNGFKKIMDEFTRDIDIKNIAQLETELENLATTFSNEGISAVIDARMVMDEVYGDIWYNQTKESVDLFHKRVLEGIWDEEKFRPLYEENMKRQIADYKMARKYDIQMAAGMIVGLGLDDDISKSLLISKMQQYDNQNRYITEEHKLFMKYGDKNSPDYDWEYYSKSKLEMCQKVLDEKLEGAKQYDKIIIDYLRNNLEKSYTAMIDEYEESLNHIIKLRAELNAKEIEWLSERLNDSDPYHKEFTEYDDHSLDRFIFKNNIMAQLHDATRTFQEIESGIVSKSKDKIKLTHEQTLALELIYREAQKTVSDYGEFLEHFIDKSDPKTMFEPADFSNSNVKESFVDYAKRTSDPVELNNAKMAYAHGDAVPLGSVDLHGTENTIGKVNKAPSPETGDTIIDNDLIRIYKPIEVNANNSNELNSLINAINKSKVYDEVKESILIDLNNKRSFSQIIEYAKYQTRDIVRSKLEGILSNKDLNMPDNVKNNIVVYLLAEIGLEKSSENIENSANKIKNIINKLDSDTKEKLNSTVKKGKYTIDTVEKTVSKYKESIYEPPKKTSNVTNPETAPISEPTTKNKVVTPETTNNNTQPETTPIVEKNIPAQFNDDILSENRKADKEALESVRESIENTDSKDPAYQTLKETEKLLLEHMDLYLQQAQRELDIKHKKFDSYNDYANWLSENGIILSEDKNFIPAKYQSDKYLSDLKETILKASKERARLESELRDIAIKKADVDYDYDARKIKSSRTDYDIDYAKEHGIEYTDDDLAKKGYDIRNAEDAKEIIENDWWNESSKDKTKDFNDKKIQKDVADRKAIQDKNREINKSLAENEKALIEKLAHDDYYREWLDTGYKAKDERISISERIKDGEVTRGKINQDIKKLDPRKSGAEKGTYLPSSDLDWSKLLRTLDENPKFNPDLSLDSRRSEPIEYKKSEPAPKYAPGSYEAKLEKTIRESLEKGEKLLGEKNALEQYKKHNRLSEKERAKISKDISKVERQIVELSDNLRDTLKNDEYYHDNFEKYGSFYNIRNYSDVKIKAVLDRIRTNDAQKYDQLFDQYGLFKSKYDFLKLKEDFENDSRFNGINDSTSQPVIESAPIKIDEAVSKPIAEPVGNIPDIASVDSSVQPDVIIPETPPIANPDNSPVQEIIEQITNNTVPNPEPEINIGTEYSPINPNFKPSDAKFSQVASTPFYYDNHFVKAGVYYEGNLIAYISSDMPDVLHVGESTFPVIGIDINNPEALWVYVHDEPELITPGKPNNIVYTIFANGEHPMRYGSTPVTQPWGQAAWETSLPLREALGFWRDEALDATYRATQNGNFFGKLTPEQQEAIYSWADGKLRSAYNYQRFASQRYGNTMVDLAMLNYDDRHGFDNLLTTIMPYQYWITRSVMNWGRRMIDKPSWFSTYARLEKLIEKNKRDFLPTRLEGLPGIPLPFLPEGLGQGLYYDPYNIQMPFKQFFNMTEYFNRNLHTIHKNTISIIEELYRQRQPYDGHIITEKEYNDAMLGKGDLYNKIFWEQRNSDETNTGLSGLVSSYFNPNVLVSSLWKAIESKSKNGKDISYSPMYKLGNTLRSSARDTAAEGIMGILADVLQMPDKAWRSMLNVESDPIGSAWTDYWTVKYLSNMLYTKEHSKSEVVNAIAEGENNPLWQEARNRYSTSEAYKQPGGALLAEIMQSLFGNKKTSIGNLSGTALASIFGGKTYPGGEEDFRRMQQLYNEIKDNEGMRNAFSAEFPEYKVGYYANIDNREELLHKILVDNCWDAYNALPESQKKAAYNGLGAQFQELFVNKNTRATDKIDNDTLVAWTQAMHGNVPNIANKTINQPLQDAFNIQWYNDSVQGLLDRYNRDKQQRYPGIDTIERGYFRTRLQDQYLALHPELKDYWNWKESVGMANPQLGAYLKNNSAQNQVNSGKYSSITEAVKAQVNKYTRTCLENHIKKGWTLPAAAEYQLKVAYSLLGANIPFEQWLREIRF